MIDPGSFYQIKELAERDGLNAAQIAQTLGLGAPAVRKWLPGKDSNPDSQDQNLLCYHYTTGQRLRESVL